MRFDGTEHVTYYVWNENGQLVAEMNAQYVVTRKYVRVGTQLVKGIFEGGEEYYYLHNAHGDVTGLANDDGEVVERYTYGPFGELLEGDPQGKNPFRYCGEYVDIETGSIYLRARIYTPANGRFTQEDTHWNHTNSIYGDNVSEKIPDLSAILQSSNLYVYCMSNPIFYVDSLGTMARNTLLQMGVYDNPDVVRLQRRLNELGYYGMNGGALAVDGDFGANTEYAVRLFQKRMGLAVDGIVGKDTWTALGLSFDSDADKNLGYYGTPGFYQKGFYASGSSSFLRLSGEVGAGTFGGDYRYGFWNVNLFNANGAVGINRGGWLGATAEMIGVNGGAKIPLPNGRTLVIEVNGSVGSIGGKVIIDLAEGFKVEVAYGYGVGIGVRVE